MHFDTSTRNERLTGSILHCDCLKDDGVTWNKNRTVDLDELIGDYDGYFDYKSTHYYEKSKDESLIRERDDEGVEAIKLTAQLLKNDNTYRERQGVFLHDRVLNENGTLLPR
ncbi:hypothetical protein BDV27DRAFT_139135 [Aspergillus caelatus]|uniref:Cyanovirin-N domain-containing protein n=1 Tax=Aspergillus caelatus TaxID=61420 RepID=A0A5N6ZIU7_9EURO|nr:uncharacterized protein BDV27DRAFT_139135 [Aspergillus caelatus]KAE8357562.1 hypothetical protein BDV27DRAFT_139135 [Aspergillus caelatus]